MAVLREGVWGLPAGRFSCACNYSHTRSGLCTMQDVVCVLQLGAGMESFMIKTGFYNKYAQSRLLIS